MLPMLDFEREVVACLIASPDPEVQAGVTEYVDRAFRSMPEYLRLGVAAESLLLGSWVRLRRGLGRQERTLDAQLATWEASAVGPLHQYVRLLRSLVLFAECELTPAAG